MTTARQRLLLDTVRALLPEVQGKEPLVAEWELADAPDIEDDTLVIKRASDGRKHLVYVHESMGLYSAETSVHNDVDLGDGMRDRGYDGVRHGRVFEPAVRREGDRLVETIAPGFPEDFKRVMRAATDAFEPVRGPGVAFHPLFPAILRKAREALAAHNAEAAEDDRLAPVLNARPGGDEDVLTFVRPDGSEHPVSVSTANGAALVLRQGHDGPVATVPRARSNAESLDRNANHFAALPDVLLDAIRDADLGLGTSPRP